jgi:hypothetical protein
LQDAQRRLDHDRKFPNEPKQLKQGEEVKIIDNRVQVSGQIAVMEINGMLAKTIFENNPDREFYIEESFPLDWMYPYLTPEGPIFKINRQRIENLPAAVVATDRRYWDKRVKDAIGWKVTEETPIADVCAFADKIYARGSLDEFEGDPGYLREPHVQTITAKLRGAIAGLYAWRAKQATSAPERRRMVKEAELAFKQAYALGPRTPEVIYRFTTFLLENGRKEDARRFVRPAARINPGDEQIAALALQLE